MSLYSIAVSCSHVRVPDFCRFSSSLCSGYQRICLTISAPASKGNFPISTSLSDIKESEQVKTLDILSSCVPLSSHLKGVIKNSFCPECPRAFESCLWWVTALEVPWVIDGNQVLFLLLLSVATLVQRNSLFLTNSMGMHGREAVSLSHAHPCSSKSRRKAGPYF